MTRENYPLVMDVLRLLGLERAGEIEEHFESIFAEETEKEQETQVSAQDAGSSAPEIQEGQED